jgi:8-oxo-dGTP pyrophosphatase MutT (NUDIX family)
MTVTAHGRRRLVRVRRLLYRVAYHAVELRSILLRPRLRGVKCVLSHGGEVLAVRHTYGPRAWHLPGGGLRRGEQPAAAAVRELREELGLVDLPLRPLGTHTLRVRGSEATLHCYGAALESRSLAPDPVEIAEVAWMAPDALADRLGDWEPPLRAVLVRAASQCS